MNRLWLVCLFTVVLPAVSAQETVPEGFEHWSLASIKEMSPGLETEAAKNSQHLASRRLADFPNDLFMLAHRETNGQPEWHETMADIFVVESGSATLLVGGKLVGAQETEPHEKRNGTIQGGVKRKLSVGDIVRIPPKTPHQILLDGARQFTYFVVKVKGY